MTKYIAHLLPKSNEVWTDDETCVTMGGGDWERYTRSIIEFCELVQPNILIEHEVDGGTVGRALTCWVDESGLHAKIEIDPTKLPHRDFRWVSPRIAWNHIDVHGRVWPAALLEISLVSIPRFLVGQNPLRETLMSQRLTVPQKGTSTLACTEMQEAPELEIEVEMTPEMLEALRGLIRAELAKLTPMADPLATPLSDPLATPLSDPLATPLSDPLATPLSDPLAVMADPIATPLSDPLAVMADPYAAAMADPAQTATLSDPLAVLADPASATTVLSDLVAPVATMADGQNPADFVATLSEPQKTTLLTDLLTKMAQQEQVATMSQIKKILAVRGIDTAKAAHFYRMYRLDKRAFVSTMSAIPAKSGRANTANAAGYDTSDAGLVAEALRRSRQGAPYEATLKALRARHARR